MRTVKDTTLAPLGDQQITSLSAAVGLTVPKQATFALLQAETQNVRWRDSGSDPTAAVGQIIYAGDIGFWYNGDLTAIKFIEVAGSAKLNVSYYK